MPGGITIDVQVRDVTRREFQRFVDAISRPEIRKVMGRAIANRLRRHFTRLDRERANKLGGQRTHFYGQARRGVQQPELVGGDGVKVSINHVGIAQRFFGGDIVPRQAKFLTLPVHPSAYGHRAREFDDLAPIFFDDGTGILVRKDADAPERLGEVFYRLVRSVHQKADPSVLPSREELHAAAFNAADEHLLTLIARAKG